MKKTEMTKLLTLENGKLMLDGYDLVEIANMYHLSVGAFFELLKYYFIVNQGQLRGELILTSTQNELTKPLKYVSDFIDGSNKEILVDGEEYEDIKKRIFDFAYTYCSDVGDTKFDSWGLVYADEHKLKKCISNVGTTYSCIYRSFRKGWNQKVSNVPIDREDQAKRFALIKKAN